MSFSKTLPKARQSNLIIQELQTELLVFDLENNRALCLNPTSMLIWQSCDGKTTYQELSAKLKEKLQTKIEEDFIKVGLKELNQSNLLDSTLSSSVLRVSRRKVLMKYALPTISLPIIMSLVVPVPAQTSSCVSPALNELCDVGQTICCPGLECTFVAGEGICLPGPCNGPGLNALCDPGQTICCPGLICTPVAGEGICLPPP